MNYLERKKFVLMRNKKFKGYLKNIIANGIYPLVINTSNLYNSGISKIEILGNTEYGKDISNLFDKDNFNYINAYFSSQNTMLSYDNAFKTIYIECKGSTTYKIIRTKSTNRFTVGCTQELPAPNITVTNISTLNSVKATEYITITTNSDSKYLVIYCFNSNIDTEEDFNKFVNGLVIRDISSNLITNLNIEYANSILCDKYENNIILTSNVDRSEISYLIYGKLAFKNINNMIGKTYCISCGKTYLNNKNLNPVIRIVWATNTGYHSTIFSYSKFGEVLTFAIPNEIPENCTGICVYCYLTTGSIEYYKGDSIYLNNLIISEETNGIPQPNNKIQISSCGNIVNIFDGKIEAGMYSSTNGNKIDDIAYVGSENYNIELDSGTSSSEYDTAISHINYVRNTNYIPVTSGECYNIQPFISGTIIFYYDSAKNFISSESANNSNINIPSNCHFINFESPYIEGVDTYKIFNKYKIPLKFKYNLLNLNEIPCVDCLYAYEFNSMYSNIPAGHYYSYLRLYSSFFQPGKTYTFKSDEIVNTKSIVVYGTKNGQNVIHENSSIEKYVTTTIPTDFDTIKYMELRFDGSSFTDTSTRSNLHTNLALFQGEYDENLEEYLMYDILLDEPLNRIGTLSDTIEINFENKTAYRTNYIKKIILTGDENYFSYDYNGQYNGYATSGILDGSYNRTLAYCNYFYPTHTSTINTSDMLWIGVNNNNIYFPNSSFRKDDIIADRLNFISWIKQKYTEGDPVTIYYQALESETIDISDQIDWNMLGNLAKRDCLIESTSYIKPSNISVSYYSNTWKE